MKLLTAAIIKQLEKNSLYSGESKNVVPVIVKFFAPWSGYTFYVVEAERVTSEDGSTDWKFFGLVTGLDVDELGYTMLSEIESIRGRFGLRIERDMHFSEMVLDKSNNEIRRADSPKGVLKCAE
jgi:Protein of unknown function (DUF2958)